MGGTNPYIEKVDYELPKTSYAVTFIQPNGSSTTVPVDPEKIPYGPTGLPGSILDIAMGHGVDLEHVCGGVCACSTCHVIVKQGLETCNEGTDKEGQEIIASTGTLPIREDVPSIKGYNLVPAKEAEKRAMKLDYLKMLKEKEEIIQKFSKIMRAK